jgi:hypothetical protein
MSDLEQIRSLSGFVRRVTLMPVFAYRYELRRGDEVIATGHLTGESALEIGERIVIAGMSGIVRSIVSALGARELNLVVQLTRGLGL